MRIIFVFGLLAALVACNSGDVPAEAPEAPEAAAEAPAPEAPEAEAADAAAAGDEAAGDEAAAGDDAAHADADAAHAAHDGAACSCTKGKEGETVWCASCSKGYIGGQATKDKAEVDAAMASTGE